MNTLIIKASFMSLALAAAGCTSKLEYDSHPDTEGLRALRGRRVLILQFDYKDDVLVGAEPLDRSLGDTVTSLQKDSFMRHFGSLFALEDVSRKVAEHYGKTADFGGPELARRVQRDFGGDGGFVITTAYAYEMAGGSLKERLEDEGLKKVLPEKAVKVLRGPSQVEQYDFASKAVLLNSEGRVVWSFFGKAMAMPTFSTLFQPREFARSVAGLDPSAQGLAVKMGQMSDEYTQYLSWLMQRDLAGVLSKNYFQDYPADRRNKYLSVFPAETKAFAPFVKGYGQLD
jgi:hypothetical protein